MKLSYKKIAKLVVVTIFCLVLGFSLYTDIRSVSAVGCTQDQDCYPPPPPYDKQDTTGNGCYAYYCSVPGFGGTCTYILYCPVEGSSCQASCTAATPTPAPHTGCNSDSECSYDSNYCNTGQCVQAGNNGSCYYLDICPTSTPSPTSGGCPAGQTSPHLACNVNTCTSLAGCGVNSCSPVGSACGVTPPVCPAGQTKPHMKLDLVNFTCTSDNTSCGTEECETDIVTINISPTPTPTLTITTTPTPSGGGCALPGETNPHLTCIANTCTSISGCGPNSCSGAGSFCSGGGPTPTPSYVSFDTPPHPFPQPMFSYLPTNPNADELIQFTDHSICYDATGIAPSCSSWDWDFSLGNGSGVNPTFSYPSPVPMIYPVTEFVCDGDTNCCPASKDVTVGGGGSTRIIPRYKEVAPQ